MACFRYLQFQKQMAKKTGAFIREMEFKKYKPFSYKYKTVLQLLVLKKYYKEISIITGFSPQHIHMIAARNAPHLLYGRGMRKKENDTFIHEIRQIKKDIPKEKYWNPKTMRYE